MPRENAAAKARRYLGEGRLIVVRAERNWVRAVCRGDGAVWHPRFEWGSWSCDCPARSVSCAHLVALRLVTAPDVRDGR